MAGFNLWGFNPIAAVQKAFGDKSADVFPNMDNVSMNRSALMSGGLVSALQGTDANAPGGSKYVAPVQLPTQTQQVTPTTQYTPGVNVNGGDGGGGGGGAPIDQATLNAIMSEISGLDGGLRQAKDNNQRSYQSTLDNYNTDAAAQTANKDQSLNTNDLNYLASQQSALVNSAKLRQSLLGTLIGMGALNGDGIKQANSTIGGALQTDLTGANSNYAGNANNVLTAFDQYTKENEARKKSLEQTLGNVNTAADNSFATNKQDYLKQLAGLYPVGSTQGGDFLKQALALGPQIQATSNVPQYDFSPIHSASFNAPDLAKYLSGTNQLSVAGQDPTGGVGSFSTVNKKRTDLTAPLAMQTAN